ncbi:shikimate dehydrogenase [Paenibacillus sediminis]|uniref:Shikimate dehydrogenase (NADP(+)) n=1 Tax=Paenibacillus sediminis TaxID=664909 RepID=A0ABS4GYI8_9BACL|nr:shikimate dehydrogenase [Paenibacillus sediminis]MBP1935348.1 shikimate dehydrogenase [Paenibacillus sediminis]
MSTLQNHYISSSGSLLLGVMGDPISHSKSPIMHNAALVETGLTGSYVPLHVKPDKLEEAIKGITALGFRGVNVTIPHKVEVMKFLHHVDESARLIGAVNTIMNDNGVLTGYNTDGIGYVRSLKEEVISDLYGSTIMVIGAGGAARGIIYALAKENPARIIIANRTADKAKELANEWSSHTDILGISTQEALPLMREIDILINTTSVGMHPNVTDIPIDPHHIPEGIIVSDLIYNPLKTRFLLEAERKSCRIHSGLGMFIYQGAYAFEYWTGTPAPIATMRESVLRSLEG